MDSWYKIGFVSKTHGLKGGVTIVLTDGAPDLHVQTTIFIDVKGHVVAHLITEYSDRTDKAFVRFEGVTTPEQAEQLRGCSLFLPKTERSRLDRGEFYDDEVVGFEVEDEAAGTLGTVREVLQMGPNRLLAVNGPEKEILIPVNGPFIKTLNKTKKKFIVALPDGFLEI